MSYLSERVSYLRGLAEGLKVDTSTKEGELLNAIIDVLDDIVEEVDASADAQDELFDMIENIAELDNDCGCGCDDDDCDCDDMDYFEIQCDNCGNTIYLDEDLLDSETDLECPVCKEKIEIEFEDCDCDDDCDCCH